MKELSEIEINLDSVQEGLKLWISSKRDGTLFDGIETAIDLTLLGRYYERCADHAVSISRRLYFLVTGNYPGETN